VISVLEHENKPDSVAASACVVFYLDFVVKQATPRLPATVASRGPVRQRRASRRD